MRDSNSDCRQRRRSLDHYTGPRYKMFPLGLLTWVDETTNCVRLFLNAFQVWMPSFLHKQLVVSLPRLSGRYCHLLFFTPMISVMLSHFEFKHRCLGYQSNILSNRWQYRPDSLGKETTSCLYDSCFSVCLDEVVPVCVWERERMRERGRRECEMRN